MESKYITNLFVIAQCELRFFYIFPKYNINPIITSKEATAHTSQRDKIFVAFIYEGGVKDNLESTDTIRLNSRRIAIVAAEIKNMTRVKYLNTVFIRNSLFTLYISSTVNYLLPG